MKFSACKTNRCLIQTAKTRAVIRRYFRFELNVLVIITNFAAFSCSIITALYHLIAMLKPFLEAYNFSCSLLKMTLPEYTLRIK